MIEPNAVNSELALDEGNIAMLRSEAERILRKFVLETKAQFTEEQILCLSQTLLKISEQVTEEALGLYKPKGSGR